MAVTIRGTPVFDGTNATTTASSRAPAVTAGTVPGELLVAAVCWSGSTITLTNPSGWTLLHNTQQTNDNLAVYYRYADGTGTDSPTFTLSLACTCIAFNATFSGAALSGAPVSANVLGGAASTTATYPAITPANATDLLVYLPGIRPTTASTQPALSTLPAGGTGGSVTQVAFNSTNVSGAAESALGILTQQLTAATAISQETSTISTSSSCDCEALCIAAAASAPAPLVMPQAPGWFPAAPGVPGGEPFTPWPVWSGPGFPLPVAGYTATYPGLYGGAEITLSTAQPVFLPGNLPGMPGGEPFTPWPLYVPGAIAVPQDTVAAAATVTATATAALTESKPLTAAATVTAARAAALTEAKPSAAASTVTAAGAAAETTAKPLTAASTVTATAAAALSVAKAGVTPVPAYAPAWFPSAPGVPGGEPFAPWPVWSGFGGASTPQDALTATATITAARAAVLTEAKPLTAAVTVTAAVTASLTTAKPLTAATTVIASRSAAQATAKPLSAAAAITAARGAALADVPGLLPFVPAPQYVPAWFPGAPGIPAMEVFAPWPPWTGVLITASAATRNATSAPAVTARDTSATAVTERTAVSAAVYQPQAGSTYTGTYGPVYGPAAPVPLPTVTGKPGAASVTESTSVKPSVSDG